MADGIDIEVLTGDDGLLVTKTASHEAGCVRLAQEAARLDRARHPGVVELLEHEAGRLVLAWAGTPTLAVVRPPVTQAAAILAAVAATVADLHEIGLVHGRLDPTHVVIGPDGRPRLCGIGGLRPGEPDPAPADDVSAVGRLIDGLLGADVELEPIPEKRWGRRRWSGYHRRALQMLADQATDVDPARRPTARALAASIAEAVPDAHIVASEPAATAPTRRPTGARLRPRREPDRPDRLVLRRIDEAPPSPPGPDRNADAAADEPVPDVVGASAGLDAETPAGPLPEPCDTPYRERPLPIRDVDHHAPGAPIGVPAGDPRRSEPRPEPAPSGEDRGIERDIAAPHGEATDIGGRPGPTCGAPPTEADDERPGQLLGGGTIPPAHRVETGPLDGPADDTFLGLRIGPVPGEGKAPAPPRPHPADPQLRRAGKSSRARTRRARRVPVLAAVGLLALVAAAGWFRPAPSGRDDASTRTGAPSDLAGAPGAPEPGAAAPTTVTAVPTTTVVAPDSAADGRSCVEVSPPTADVDGDGCPEAIAVSGTSISVGAASYDIGEVGDRVAVGDWDCDGLVTAGLVRPATGEVFLFDEWTGAGGVVTVEAATVVPGAQGLEPTSAGDGCGGPTVRLADQSTRQVDVSGTSP